MCCHCRKQLLCRRRSSAGGIKATDKSVTDGWAQSTKSSRTLLMHTACLLFVLCSVFCLFSSFDACIVIAIRHFILQTTAAATKHPLLKLLAS
jgi:hypothetical protein